MLKVNPKKFGKIRRFRNGLLKRLHDPFYLVAIILIAIGVLCLNYSYIEPKPFNSYIEDNVYSVNINNSSVFYAPGFDVGGTFYSNITFINPNGTNFSYRLYCIAFYQSGGLNCYKNYTRLAGKTNKTYCTRAIHYYGPTQAFSLIINTSAKNLTMTVIERAWVVTSHSKIIYDEIGTPFLIGGLVFIVSRLSYNTSPKTMERKLANEKPRGNKQIKN